MVQFISQIKAPQSTVRIVQSGNLDTLQRHLLHFRLEFDIVLGF